MTDEETIRDALDCQQVREAVDIQKLPARLGGEECDPIDEIVDCALAALDPDRPKCKVPFGVAPEAFQLLGSLLQQALRPDAPELEMGGLMDYMVGRAEMPAWIVADRIAARIYEEATSRGTPFDPT